MMENFRPITVWAAALLIHYTVSTMYFEAWTSSSKYQVIGLLALLYGSAIYSAPNPGSLKLTGNWISMFLDFRHEYPVDYEKLSTADSLESGDSLEIDSNGKEEGFKPISKIGSLNFVPLSKPGSIIDGRYGHIVKKTKKVIAKTRNQPHEDEDVSVNLNPLQEGMKESEHTERTPLSRSSSNTSNTSEKMSDGKYYINGHAPSSGKVGWSLGARRRRKFLSKRVLEKVASGKVTVQPTDISSVKYDTVITREFEEDPALDLCLSTEARRAGGFRYHRYSNAGLDSMEKEGQAFYIEDY
eukprot:CAMPEP_0182432692 /NCGR_PEP_ID=MMETSP1167-20130531/58257_1 /TAXON_ID=2988 /ORGANISM="Mallomonas Sp, Strain CCMP3275" /LENGTH=298 /DNA_ID=CAMNT_0024620513 /DNA_START=147 /DNA_END=1043 /DNA_ORIENTATION=+